MTPPRRWLPLLGVRLVEIAIVGVIGLFVELVAPLGAVDGFVGPVAFGVGGFLAWTTDMASKAAPEPAGTDPWWGPAVVMAMLCGLLGAAALWSSYEIFGTDALFGAMIGLLLAWSTEPTARPAALMLSAAAGQAAAANLATRFHQPFDGPGGFWLAALLLPYVSTTPQVPLWVRCFLCAALFGLGATLRAPYLMPGLLIPVWISTWRRP